MTPKDFFELVMRMREAQKQYFAKKDTGSLKLAKNLEMQVDAAIEKFKGML